jgi:hypothetical protein
VDTFSPEEVSLIQQVKEVSGEGDLAGIIPEPEFQDAEPLSVPPARGPSSKQLLKILGEDGVDMLGREICDAITEAEIAMSARRDREEELWEYYAQSSAVSHGSDVDTDSDLVSEEMMVVVDQAHARLFEQMTSVQPLPQGEPVVKGDDDEMTVAQDFAEATGRFLHSFLTYKCNMRKMLRETTFLAPLLGTGVVHPVWEDDDPMVEEGIEQRVKDPDSGRIKFKTLESQNTFCWPVTESDWQECEIVGHRMHFTTSQLFAYARQLALTPTEVQEIMADSGESSDEPDHELSQIQQGVARSDSLDEQFGRHVLTQVYGKFIFPNDPKMRTHNCVVVVDELRNKIVRIWENPNANGMFPYFPIRYKVVPNQAWGVGAGDEVINPQAADSALWNLSMANVKAGAFNVNLVKAGTLGHMQVSNMSPGEVLAVDDTDDFESVQVGGQADGIFEAINDVRFRSQRASGQPASFSGQADPILKSGASTGQTNMLKAEAGKKISNIDESLRDDFTMLFSFCLDMVAQYLPTGATFLWASEDDAHKISYLKQFWAPKTGAMRDRVRIAVRAPSAETSRASRQQTGMMMTGIMQQQIQFFLEMGQQTWALDNPEGFRRYSLMLMNYHADLVRTYLRDTDVPNIAGDFPLPPEPTPQDEVINQKDQEIQQMQMQAQQMQMQMQQLIQLLPPELQLQLQGGVQ